MEDRRLALLRELERADEAVAAELAEVDELYDTVEELRERALELQELVRRLPDERAGAAAAVSEADRALTEARAAVEQAAEAVARAEGDQEQLAEARRFEVRACDFLHVAERRATAAREEAAELEARAAAAQRETAELESRARELGAVLARRPRLSDAAVAEPGHWPEGVAEWGTRARAALLVARSQVAAERDATVRQAHELAAAVLGEPLPALSAAAAVRRVERDLES